MTPIAEIGAAGAPKDVSAVISIEASGLSAYVPPHSDYKDVSQGWVEAEYRCVKMRSDHVMVGFWTGEPGHVSFDAWPYTEVCSILSGRVAVRDRFGGEKQFGPGSGFVVPKGWAGDWVTLETSSKIFIAIDTPSVD
jgi:uncharacterized cupin superfamily protein